jgi:predicted porin
VYAISASIPLVQNRKTRFSHNNLVRRKYMNKKLLAVAIGAALAAPMYAQAAVTVGGQAHVSADYVDTLDAPASIHNTKVWNVSSNVTNIFIKADEDLGSGMKAIFFLQEYFRLDDNAGATQTGSTGTAATANPSVGYGTRMHDAPAYVGLSSNAGTILLGNQDTLTKLANRSVDLFNNAIGDTRNLGMDNTRFQNSVSYTSPTMGGVTLAWQHSTNVDNGVVTPLATSANGFTGTTTNTAQNYGDVFAVKFAQGPVVVNGAYMRLDNRLSTSAAYYTNQVTDLSASVKAGPARIVAAYQKNNNASNAVGVQTGIWSLGAALTFGNETVKGQFSSLNADTAASVGRNSTLWSIGYDHAFSKTFTGYAAFAVADNDSGATKGMAGGGGHGDSPAVSTSTAEGGPQQNGVSLGVIYSF